MDIDTVLVQDPWEFAQAEHFAELAGLFGEGAVLVGTVAEPKPD